RHAAQAHDEELGELAPELAAAVLAEGPEAVADPVGEDREAGRDDFGEYGALVQVLGREDGDAQQVEDAEVDHEAHEPDDTDARELGDELAHASCLPRDGP